MKYQYFIFLVIVSCSCATNRNSTKSNADHSASHEFVAGEWLHTYSLNKLRQRDLTEPQPFTAFTPVGRDVSIRSCYKDGKPYYYDMSSFEHGHLDKIDSVYQWINKDSAIVTLHFSVQEKDTVLIYERRYKSFEPYTCSLSKAPWITSCDIPSSPTPGYLRAYNQLYFVGNYEVRELASNKLFTVEITPDREVVGFPGFNSYNLDPHNVLLFKLYELEIIERDRMTPEGEPYPPLYLTKNLHSYSMKGHDNGFDLCTYGSLITYEQRYLEKVYEFRRK